MVELGVGKNMFRAIRFWVQATDVARNGEGRALHITDFGRAILHAYDPYLEDIRTIWLLHWKIATHSAEPLFAWYHLLNIWNHPEISCSQVLPDFEKYAVENTGRSLSPITLTQHYDMFIHSYVPKRQDGGTIQEDMLDCPLIELALVQKISERATTNTNRREAIYAFRREEKPEITAPLFAYALFAFWHKHASSEQTLRLRDIVFAPNSPGQIFKLSEWDIRQRLISIEDDTDSLFSYQESSALQQLIRRDAFARASEHDVLETIYN